MIFVICDDFSPKQYHLKDRGSVFHLKNVYSYTTVPDKFHVTRTRIYANLNLSNVVHQRGD